LVLPYLEYLKAVENPHKAGYSELLGRWFPHKSVEDSTLTIGYGHKLTSEEHATWLLTIPRKPTKNDSSVSYVVDWKTKGLTDMDVDTLLKADIALHYDYAEDLWNASVPGTPFNTLPEKYQTVLTDWVFATGYLHNKPLIRAILAGDDEKVYNAMVLHVNGKPMFSRRDALAKAVGLEVN